MERDEFVRREQLIIEELFADDDVEYFEVDVAAAWEEFCEMARERGLGEFV